MNKIKVDLWHFRRLGTCQGGGDGERRRRRGGGRSGQNIDAEKIGQIPIIGFRWVGAHRVDGRGGGLLEVGVDLDVSRRRRRRLGRRLPLLGTLASAFGGAAVGSQFHQSHGRAVAVLFQVQLQAVAVFGGVGAVGAPVSQSNKQAIVKRIRRSHFPLYLMPSDGFPGYHHQR